MATPYTDTKAVDYEDLAREVNFLARCEVHGMVWPQLASEYSRLTKEERLKGMKVLARAAAGKKPALVLGIQGRNTAEALEYLRCAEEAAPDAVIAIPPTEAKSLDDFREYYTTLARETKRPFFVQTTGGAPNIEPTVEFRSWLKISLRLCRKNSTCDRPNVSLAAHRPTIKGIFSGQAGRGMMPRCAWVLMAPCRVRRMPICTSRSGTTTSRARVKGRELFAAFDDQPGTAGPGTCQYVMQNGVFKTMSRPAQFHWTPEGGKLTDLGGALPYLLITIYDVRLTTERCRVRD
jgi:hypothetical protein